MNRDDFNMAQSRASAREILIGLGIERSLIPSTFDDLDERARIGNARIANKERREQVKQGKRRRRTKAQMQQLKAFTEWQFR